MKIGLLEDDRTLSYGIKRFLVQEGYSVQEYRILIALMRKNNEVLSRESLYELLGLDDDAYA